jgi:hypothetical protein
VSIHALLGMPGGRALTKAQQALLAKIVAGFVTFDKEGCKPRKLLRLERHKKRDEEVVTPGVLTRHEIFLTQVFDEISRGVPSRGSIQQALLDGVAVHNAGPSVVLSKIAWARDEAEQLAMVWRYVWFSRGEGSRCLACGRLKACLKKTRNKNSSGRSCRRGE